VKKRNKNRENERYDKEEERLNERKREECKQIER
jgi:hypothetical protein